jgi:hypothetical protein
MSANKKRNKISVSLIIENQELHENQVFPNEIKEEITDTPYYLLIFIPRKDVTKINCFPISDNKITKILIKLKEFSPNLVKGISNILKNLDLNDEILHTTGLCFELEDCYYESYVKAENLDRERLKKIKEDFLKLNKVTHVEFNNVKTLT